MIPKKIHYVRVWWKDFPELEKKCINTWKEILPDYELCLWNEKNFDLNMNRFIKWAYEYKKFAFVSDFIRIRVLYNYWWIYLDTDVEVIKPLDEFLNLKWFWWFERNNLITTWVIWAEKWNKFIKEILDYYANIEFDINNLIPNPEIITNIAYKNFWFKWWRTLKVNLENSIYTIYPENYFCPKYNRKKCLSRNDCYVIHHFTWSRMNQSKRKANLKKRIVSVLKSLWLYSAVLNIRIKINNYLKIW